MKQSLIVLFSFTFFFSYSQEQTTQLNNPSLRQLINAIETISNYKFAYDNKLDTSKNIGFDITVDINDIEAVFDKLAQNTGYTFNRLGNNITVTMKDNGRKYRFSGTVLGGDNEPVMGANVYVNEFQTGAVTDENGLFSLSLPRGEYTIHISYIGFVDITEKIELYQDTTQAYTLFEDSEMLDEIVITKKQKNIADIRTPQMSMNRLSTEQIKRTPVVLGESDPLKSLMQLPGVTNAGEGSSGFNVRGGAADQNLVLLDGTPIYSDSHLFGFFSVFNADAISNLDLYKGGIPSRFGGRVSSVLDAHQKTGNRHDFHANGGIGLISSRLTAEGPLKKEKGAFMLSGRSSYAHLFLKLAGEDNSAYFYDLNTRLDYQLNDNNTLYLSGYYGRDVFDISESFFSTFGNTMLNLRWNHRFSDNLASDLAVFYSDYRFGLVLSIQDFVWDNAIESYGLNYDFTHSFSENFSLQYGANAIYYDFNPGTLQPENMTSTFNYIQLDKKYALEPSLYLDAEHTISEKLSVRYGFRYSMFYRFGPEDIHLYENNQPVIFNPVFQIYEKGTSMGATSYASGEKIAGFDNIEPRVGISYALDDHTSLKISYNRMTQYLHMLSNTQSPTPVNIWTPSGPFIKPQLLDQVALGYFKNFANNAYTIETEVFYKTVQNRIDYIDGADLIGNNNIEQVILNGEARSYGWEFLFRKNTGKFTGWIAYTLSRAEQKTPGRTPEETGIANGDWYLSPYDKLHNLVVTGSYKLNDKWSFAANFTLQSGQPVTFPNGQYHLGGLTIPNYGSRNDSRLPIYHHLDMAATYIPKPEKKKGWQSEWVFSVYNIYNRMNAASIMFAPNETTGVNEAVRLSIFGVIPSVSYNFKF